MTDTGRVIATSIIVCGNLAGGGTVESTLLFHRWPPAEQVGQLRDVGGYAPCLVAGDQLSRRATARAQAVWKGVGMSTIVNATLASAIVEYRSEQNRLPDRSRRSLGHLLALI